MTHSAARRRFWTLDVFTTERFAGNPLAVVLDAAGLDSAAMQQIAREFNLSETVFVFPPEQAAHRARLRIFTTATELPFAGHPTVGTAVLLGTLDGGSAREFVLEETVGPVPCRVRCQGAEAGRAEFDLPRLSLRESATLDVGEMTAALGLTPADADATGLAAERWSAGNPFTFLPLKNLDAMRRCAPDLTRFPRAFGAGGRAAVFAFCRETVDRRHAFHARMFAPGMGPLEDPATGSAVAAFSGYLHAHERYADGDHLVRIEQGYEMGRPSVIDLSIAVAGGAIRRATIAGDAVVVTTGTI
jgi:trans-2,3-dihydro-3-hydroxyanthranilate isomerase